MKSKIINLLVICILSTSWWMLNAETIHVDVNGGGDYLTIQEGINAATNGDTVLVADGIYTGVNNKDLTWDGNVKHLIVKSENGPENCIIDCENDGRGFLLSNTYQNNSDIIEGFTIRNARGESWGGGIDCWNASPTIQNNIIKSCTAGAGGGNGGGGGIVCAHYCNAIIQNNIIEDNIAYTHTVGGGGGIFCHHTDDSPLPVIIRNNIIRNNQAIDAYASCGGGIGLYYASPVIENNLIYDNHSDSFGGGIHCAISGSPIIRNNIIYGNTSPSDGGISLRGTYTELINNIIASNSYYGVYIHYGTLVIQYSDVWDNELGNYYNCNAGIGCISENPLFVDIFNYDFHFQANSPCIDTGTPDTTGMNLYPFDLDGNPRVFDGDGDGIAIIDMGCYEYGLTEHIYLEIPTEYAWPGDTVLVPINVQFPADSTFNSAEIYIGGYLGFLNFIEIVTDSSLIGDAGWMYEYHETDSLNIIWLAGAETISGEGVLFWLKFAMPDTASNFIPITLEDAIFDTGDISVEMTSGGISILTPMYGDVDLNGQIQAYDASMILQYLVGYIELNELQLVNADVSLDSTVSALDATLILQYGVGIIDTLPYPTGTSFIATGDITMEDQQVQAGAPISIPLILENSDNIFSFEAEILFNSEHLTYTDIIWSELLSNFTIENNNETGEIKISGASVIPNDEEGLFANIWFTVSEDFGENDSTFVLLQSLRWNEEEIMENVAISILSTSFGTDNPQPEIPEKYVLNQNIPNPFNPDKIGTTKIQYLLPQNSNVSLKIYNIKGELVKTLVGENKSAGSYNVIWNGKDNSGKDLVSGIYFYKIQTDKFSDIKKMLLVR